jgi:hypothetical protein
LTPQIGFFLILFDIEPVGTGKEFPVYGPGGFSLVVQAMFGKFHRKSMEGASVEAGYKTFHYLMGNEVKVVELLELLYIDQILHKNTRLKPQK